VSAPIGYGASQFASGVYNVGGVGWLMNIDGSPTKIAMIVRLVIVIVASLLSALSDVGKSVKWLSNIYMGLSVFMLAFFGLYLYAICSQRPVCRYVGLYCKLADDDSHCLVR